MLTDRELSVLVTEKVMEMEVERGVAVTCSVCHLRKAPRGRSVPLEFYLCDHECEGYLESPTPGDLWPGESRIEFGYPKELVAPFMFATDKGLALEAALKASHGDLELYRAADGECWGAQLNGHIDYRALGTTVARALCFAALRAGGVTVEDDGEGPG